MLEIFPSNDIESTASLQDVTILATSEDNVITEPIKVDDNILQSVVIITNSNTDAVFPSSKETLQNNEIIEVPDNILQSETEVVATVGDKKLELVTEIILQNVLVNDNDSSNGGSSFEIGETCSRVLQENTNTRSELEQFEESRDESISIEEKENKARKGKKRVRNPSNWQKNIRKQSKAAGEEYTSANKKVVSKKEMKGPCRDDCMKKCTQSISAENRAIIHSHYWTSELNNDQKRQFLASCIEELPVERTRNRTGARTGKRTTSLKYFFTVNGKRINVCRTFFLNTLNVSQTSVRFALAKRQVSGVVQSDQRGKHEPSNKIGPEARNAIREHIQKFPCIESHYSRNKTHRKYLGSYLNISRMYQCFYDEQVENGIDTNDIPKQWLYSDIFNTEYNLSFKEPGNDTCDQCDEYTIKLKESISPEDRQQLERQYEEHLFDADNRYKLKRCDKESGRTQDNIRVVMVDLQKCLPTPLLKNAQSFYSLKLWTFNYTVYEATEKKASCFMWDESIAGRGGNEMASCMLRYILSLNDKVQQVIIWSDNCPSQNRNHQMIMCYLLAQKLKPSIKYIEHKYLLRGHTHMEVDSIHSRIERTMKNSPAFSVVTPWDWQQLVRLCGPKIEVCEMETKDFKDFSKLHNSSSSYFQINKKTTNGQQFLISKAVVMKFDTEKPGIMHFKTSFSQEAFQEVDFSRVVRRTSLRANNQCNLSLTSMRDTLKPISTKKYNDLQKLLTWIPTRFHAYFKNLPHADLKTDDED